jgi:hypothetical protein
MNLSDDDRKNLGPLGGLVGVWEGDKGNDLAPADDRSPETNLFRERITFTPIGRVDNHEQILYGLAYTTTAWRLGVADPFHQEVGYWLWDAARGEVMRSFLVPRGIAVIAVGAADATARSFRLEATLGSPTYGICSNPFLDAQFKTVRYEVTVRWDDETLSYDEDTVMEMPGRAEPFHHTDRNTLRRVPG